MVLSEATASPSSTGDAFSSNNDSFDNTANVVGSNGANEFAAQIANKTPGSQYMSAYNIDFSRLPMPIPVFGPLLGYTEYTQKRAIAASVGAIANVINRQPTQQEAQAGAYHAAKAKSTESYGTFMGISIGLFRAFQTRTTGRLPFWKGWANSEERPWPPRVPGVPMPVQRVMWQALRFSSYAMVGMLFAGLLVTPYTGMVFAVGMGTDPNLKSLHEKMKQLQQEARLPPEQRTTKTHKMEDQAAAAARRQQAQKQSRGYDGDDMSPSGGMALDATTDTGMLTDEQIRQKERMQRPNEQAYQSDNRANTYSMDRVTRQPLSQQRPQQSFDSDSPAGGAGPFDSFSSSTQQPQNTSGSRWEQLRSQARSNQGSPTSSPSTFPSRASPSNPIQREQRQGATLGDSFSFSSSDEERQLAQAEAQRQFDERIERERQGRDFSDSSSRGGRRW